MIFIERARHWKVGTRMAATTSLLGTACMVLSLFGTSALVAQATSNPKSYVGIWKMTDQDKRIGTLVLTDYTGRLMACLPAHGHDANGKVVEFDAIPGAAPIVETSISQNMLVINAESVDETIIPWNMTLTGEGKGTLRLAFKGHEMGPIQMTRISWGSSNRKAATSLGWLSFEDAGQESSPSRSSPLPPRRRNAAQERRLVVQVNLTPFETDRMPWNCRFFEHTRNRHFCDLRAVDRQQA